MQKKRQHGFGVVPSSCPPRQRLLLQTPCAVCGALIQCNNFGVPSCQACTDFFRRSVREARKYRCRSAQQCHIDSRCRTICRSCRFKKCLHVGMKKERVRKKQFSGNVQRRASDDDTVTSSSLSAQNIIVSNEIVDFNHITFLCNIEEKLLRIRCSRTELSDAYIDQFASLEQLINSGENLLARACEFSTLPPFPWQAEKANELTQKRGIYGARPKHRILDHLLCAGLIKSLPGTAALCPSDKANFYRAISIPLCNFISAHYSVQQHSDTVRLPNGLMPIMSLRVPRYAADAQVAIFTQKLYCNALKPFSQLQLCRAEFVLLLAILMTQSSFASTFSRHGHEQLYEQCAKYTGILFRVVRRLHPNNLEDAIRRFAALLRIINHVHWMTDYYSKFATYMDVFHFRGERKQAMPKAIYPIYSASNK